MYLLFNQKIDANEPEKKIPSTAANAITLSAKEALSLFIHFRAQTAFFWIQGIVSIALKRLFLSVGSWIKVSIRREYISE